MRVLGIDPGLGNVGWAVITDKGSESEEYVLVASGVIKTGVKEKSEERLEKIYDEVKVLDRKNSKMLARIMAVERKSEEFYNALMAAYDKILIGDSKLFVPENKYAIGRGNKSINIIAAEIK